MNSNHTGYKSCFLFFIVTKSCWGAQAIWNSPHHGWWLWEEYLSPSESPKEIEFGLKGFAFIEIQCGFLSLMTGHLYCHREPLKWICTVKNKTHMPISLQLVTINLCCHITFPVSQQEGTLEWRAAIAWLGNHVSTVFVFLLPFFVVLTHTQTEKAQMMYISNMISDTPV